MSNIRTMTEVVEEGEVERPFATLRLKSASQTSLTNVGVEQQEVEAPRLAPIEGEGQIEFQAVPITMDTDEQEQMQTGEATSIPDLGPLEKQQQRVSTVEDITPRGHQAAPAPRSAHVREPERPTHVREPERPTHVREPERPTHVREPERPTHVREPERQPSSNERNEIEVFVRTLRGDVKTIRISPRAYVRDLKVKIADALNTTIHTSEYYLEHGGKRLAEERALAFYNITNHSNVHMMGRLRGGRVGMGVVLCQ